MYFKYFEILSGCGFHNMYFIDSSSPWREAEQRVVRIYSIVLRLCKNYSNDLKLTIVLDYLFLKLM